MNDDLEMGAMFDFENEAGPLKKKAKTAEKKAKTAEKLAPQLPKEQPEDNDDDVSAPQIYIMEDDDDDDDDDDEEEEEEDGFEGATEVVELAAAAKTKKKEKASAASDEARAGSAAAAAEGKPEKGKKATKKRPVEETSARGWAGADWEAWLSSAASADAARALARRVYAPGEGESAAEVIVNSVRRGSKGRDRSAPGRAVDCVLVCVSAKRAADVAKALRARKQIREVLKLFGKHLKASEQARQLGDAAKPLPRVAVATPARLEVLLDAVPWAPNATLVVDTHPDAKRYTPFTLPDAKAALARVVAKLLAATEDLAFCAADAGPSGV